MVGDEFHPYRHKPFIRLTIICPVPLTHCHMNPPAFRSTKALFSPLLIPAICAGIPWAAPSEERPTPEQALAVVGRPAVNALLTLPEELRITLSGITPAYNILQLR